MQHKDLYFVKPSLLSQLPCTLDVPNDEREEYDYLVRGEGSYFGGKFERTIYPIVKSYGSIFYIMNRGVEEPTIPTTEWFLAKDEWLNEDTLEEPPKDFFYHEKKRRGLL